MKLIVADGVDRRWENCRRVARHRRSDCLGKYEFTTSIAGIGSTCWQEGTVGCEEPGLGGVMQSAIGEIPQNNLRVGQIRQHRVIRLTIAAGWLLLVRTNNSVCDSYTSFMLSIPWYCIDKNVPIETTQPQF